MMSKYLTLGIAFIVLGTLAVPLSARAQTPTPLATAATDTTVTPEKVAAAVAQLDQRAQEQMKELGIPGMAIAVVYQDKPVLVKGYGVREAGKPDAVDADTAFQLASVSKPLASTVIAGLVSDGTVSWDDLITKYDPGFEMSDPYVTSNITIRDMLMHRSGLRDHIGDLLEDIGYDRAAVLERLRYAPLGNRFRSNYDYTNFGFTEAGVAAANAAGKTWEQVSKDRLYTPLGMTETSSAYADFINNPNHASGHQLVDGKYVFKEQRQPDAQSPAGGASSSAKDMAQWLRLLLAGGEIDGTQIITSTALAEPYRPGLVADPAPRPADQRIGTYGMGWNTGVDELGRVKLSHSGSFALGAGTHVSMIPADDLGIVILMNVPTNGVAEGLAQTFLDDATYGKPRMDWIAGFKQRLAGLGDEDKSPIDYTKPPADVMPALANDAYVGTYHNDFIGDVKVMEQGSGLVMEMGPKALQFPLTHFNQNVFSYDTIGENAVGLSGATFEVGSDGKASTLTLEQFRKYTPLDVLTRVGQAPPAGDNSDLEE